MMESGKWDDLLTNVKVNADDFMQVSVVEGSGIITVDSKTFSIEKGSNFIVSSTVKEYELSGTAEFIVLHC